MSAWCKFMLKTQDYLLEYCATEVVTQKLIGAVDLPWLDVDAASD